MQRLDAGTVVVALCGDVTAHPYDHGLEIAIGPTLASCTQCESPAGKTDAGCEESLSSGPVVEQIRALEEAGAASNVTGQSVQEAERMFSPGYLVVGPDGKVTTRETILGQWSAAAWASRFDVKELDIKVYCDIAIAVGLSEALPLGADEATKPVHFRWLNVWTKASNEWRLSATQFTRF